MEKGKLKIYTADKWCNIRMYYAHFNFDFYYIYMNKYDRSNYWVNILLPSSTCFNGSLC